MEVYEVFAMDMKTLGINVEEEIRMYNTFRLVNKFDAEIKKNPFVLKGELVTTPSLRRRMLECAPNGVDVAKLESQRDEKLYVTYDLVNNSVSVHANVSFRAQAAHRYSTFRRAFELILSEKESMFLKCYLNEWVKSRSGKNCLEFLNRRRATNRLKPLPDYCGTW